MRTLRVEFELDTAAYEDDDGGLEAARLLRHVADDVRRNGLPSIPRKLFDLRGRFVGQWQVIEER